VTIATVWVTGQVKKKQGTEYVYEDSHVQLTAIGDTADQVLALPIGAPIFASITCQSSEGQGNNGNMYTNNDHKIKDLLPLSNIPAIQQAIAALAQQQVQMVPPQAVPQAAPVQQMAQPVPQQQQLVAPSDDIPF